MSLHLITAADAYAMSTGRLGSTLAALAGIVGVAVGGLALARTRRAGGRRGSIVALAASLAGMTVGGVVLATSDGGVGTGNGLGGAFVALAVGLVGTVLGGLGLARSRRAG